MDIWDIGIKLDIMELGIKADKERTTKAKNEIIGFAARIDSIPTRHAELIAAIDALPAGDAYNDVLKARISAITAGFVPLRNAMNSASTGLQAITEF